ncbi:hypothetical protein ABFS82_04G096700 [Erythranthe guttata]
MSYQQKKLTKLRTKNNHRLKRANENPEHHAFLGNKKTKTKKSHAFHKFSVTKPIDTQYVHRCEIGTVNEHKRYDTTHTAKQNYCQHLPSTRSTPEKPQNCSYIFTNFNNNAANSKHNTKKIQNKTTPKKKKQNQNTHTQQKQNPR